MLSFNRKIQFSSGYRLHDSRLSEEENLQQYGSDYKKNLGGSFELNVHFMREGFPAIDPKTGFIVNLVDVDRWLAEVRELLTSSLLNEITTPEVPTLEVMARWIAKELEKKITEHHEDLSGKSAGSFGIGYSNAGFIVRLHKLKLSTFGRPGSVVTHQFVSLDL